MKKTIYDLDLNDLKTMIESCDWKVKILDEYLWELSRTIDEKNRFCFEVKVMEQPIFTVLAIIKYSKDFDADSYIKDILKSRRGNQYPTYEQIAKIANDIGWELIRLRLCLPSRVSDLIKKYDLITV